MEPSSPNLGLHQLIVPAPVVSQQHFTNTTRKKSKTRLNDQLIPKPTDINMAEKMIKIATPKEHPYASHISRFAMFPSFRSPDDPDTGVRAASRPFLGPLIPTAAPDVTLLSKAIGGPYRHEVLQSPMTTRAKAAEWPGEHGFLNHSKPLRGDVQVFYPTPPKIVLPNPKLRDWNHSLSERTSNMLKNMERTHWVTSYQMNYTGSGPALPLKTDDFMEKISDRTGTSSRAAPLRERSCSPFVPSKPRDGLRRRQGRRRTNSPTINQQRPQETTAEHNEAPNPNQMGQSQLDYSCGSTGSAACQSRGRENRNVKLNENLTRVSVPQSSQEAPAAQIADTEKPSDLHGRPLCLGEMEVNREESSTQAWDEASHKNKWCSLSEPAGARPGSGSHAELLSRAASEQGKVPGGRELPRRICNPCVPGRQGGASLSLLELQDSFSRSEAHRNFNSSVTYAAVDLRDNVAKGKKHDFYGINCYYLRG